MTGFLRWLRSIMAARVAGSVWELTDGGRLPLVCDAASCTHGLRAIGARLTGEAAERWAKIRVVDAVTFTRERLLPRLTVPDGARLDRVVVHPTCSTVHLEATEDLTAAQLQRHGVWRVGGLGMHPAIVGSVEPGP